MAMYEPSRHGLFYITYGLYVLVEVFCASVVTTFVGTNTKVEPAVPSSSPGSNH